MYLNAFIRLVTGRFVSSLAMQFDNVSCAEKITKMVTSLMDWTGRKRMIDITDIIHDQCKMELMDLILLL